MTRQGAAIALYPAGNLVGVPQGRQSLRTHRPMIGQVPLTPPLVSQVIQAIQRIVDRITVVDHDRPF